MKPCMGYEVDDLTCNCSTRLNDGFPIQDSADRLVGIVSAPYCRTNN